MPWHESTSPISQGVFTPNPPCTESSSIGNSVEVDLSLVLQRPVQSSPSLPSWAYLLLQSRDSPQGVVLFPTPSSGTSGNVWRQLWPSQLRGGFQRPQRLEIGKCSHGVLQITGLARLFELQGWTVKVKAVLGGVVVINCRGSASKVTG